MKVILLKDISKLGKRGEVKEVADGFGINVLIRKGDALHATPSELAKWKTKEDSKKHKQEVVSNLFVQLSESLHKIELTISGKKSDQKGQLFAQVKEADIAEAIFQVTKLSIDPKQISLSFPIKSLGSHAFILKHGDKKENLTVIVK